MSTNKTTLNPWTSALVAAGVISAAAVLQAEEAQNPVMTALSSTTISGYVDTSAIWKMGPDTGTAQLPGRSFDGADKQNQFNLNVVELNIGRPVDEGVSWGAGYNVSLLFGPDANTFGTNSSLGDDNDSDFAIKNAYVALRAPVGNGLDFKVGVWDTIVGYEVFEAGNNPNYSRSYGYYLEPYTHTGVLASYQVSDVLTIQGGIADDATRINYHSSRGKFTYMGGLTLTAPDSMGFLSGAQLSGGVISQGRKGMPNAYNYYVGLTAPTPIEQVSVGAAFDYYGTSEYSNDTTEYGYSLAGYVVCQATEKMKLAGRVEWAKTGDALFAGRTVEDRIQQLTGDNDSDSASCYKEGRSSDIAGLIGETGIEPVASVEQEFLATTVTLDYSLWANVISRAEFRWDHDLNGAQSIAGMKNAYSLALNVIYNF